ncbi:Hexokinase [Lachnellula occidentalis]|uniref:Phosphotransferase n=1 Tax=Lachnellula occidentalis TaxID=215460 RepID=A0A8H8UKB9_9HELO|nr:Hexokinase [Lachnellula occidentalis]
MQPFIAAMLKVRQAFYAAIIRSLLRTKSVLQTILNIWIAPSNIKNKNVDQNGDIGGGKKQMYAEFIANVETAFGESREKSRLVALSDGLRAQFGESLLDHPMNMLPSYNHQLPTGDECGTYLALDVGGSTFRVALIELSGRGSVGQETTILKIDSYKIASAVRQLKGALFFDWMAERISQTLSGQDEGHDMSSAPLSMGMSWSFPIEQTSLRSGLILGMGKGFLAAHGLLGKDLGDIIQDSCSRKGLNVQLNAIVNDSSATLLSKAYLDQTTRFALIVGTGLNAAVHLPVHMFSPAKFGVRPDSWHDAAKHVIVNTELSTFGAGILPDTKWDERLRAAHPMPDFQPMEYFVSGGYLGEIVRLVLVDGIQTAGLFGGIVPPSLREQYSLDTETISNIESDRSTSLSSAREIFLSRHPTSYPPTQADMHAIRLIASHVTYRASGVLAAGTHALWQLRNEAESIRADESSHTLVAYNGSVLENYPRLRATCQEQLDALVEATGGKRGVVELVYAEESSLLGAAVAVACSNG